MDDGDDSNISKASNNAVVRQLAGLGDGAPLDKQQPAKSVWLEAWSDPVAGVSAYTACVHTCNLFGDGDWRLVVADEDRKLKVCTFN